MRCEDKKEAEEYWGSIPFDIGDTIRDMVDQDEYTIAEICWDYTYFTNGLCTRTSYLFDDYQKVIADL